MKKKHSLKNLLLSAFNRPILGAIISLSLTSCVSQNPKNVESNSFTLVENDLLITTNLIPEKSTRSLSPNFMCFNVNAVRIKSWQDKEFQDLVESIAPGIIRIPGGTVANYWDWEKGGLIKNTKRLPDGLPGFLNNESSKNAVISINNFADFFKDTQITPLFVLNMLTSDLQSQIKALKNFQALGIPIEYIELGNEFYFNIKNYSSVFPNAESYADTANQWISVIRQEFPDAKISLVGNLNGKNPNKGNSRRRQDWNNSITKISLPQANALTLHLYSNSGLNFENSRNQDLFSEKDVKIMLGEAFKNWNTITNNLSNQLIPREKEIWITEYNLKEFKTNEFNSSSDDEIIEKKLAVHGTWSHGLYVLAMSLLFLEDERISMICNHMLFGNSAFASILEKKESNNRSSGNPESRSIKSFDLSSAGLSLRLFSNAVRGMSEARKINFSYNPMIQGKDGFEYPALSGWMFTNTKKTEIIILNLSAQSVNVNLNTFSSQSFDYEQIDGLPQTSSNELEKLNQKTGNNVRDIILPKYSVTRLSSSKNKW